MKLTFLGATGTVTGSKYLVEAEGLKVLVDCGLYQGLKNLRRENWEKLPFDPVELDAVILTHAPIDHSGFLPALHNRGFDGPVYCTRGTVSLCKVLLPDSGHLQEEAAKFANKHGFSRHEPAVPLYTRDEAEASLRLFKGCDYDVEIPIAGKLTVRFTGAGHIIGSSAVHLGDGKTRLVFSGDVGPEDHPVNYPPAALDGADYLVVESTYGDRLHSTEDPGEQIKDIVNRTMARDGVLVIPAFAVGRTQTVLHLLSELQRKGEIPPVPVYMDSPMAMSATQIFYDHHEEHRLDEAGCHRMEVGVQLARKPQESMAIDRRTGPMIVLSASGMATGGRILHHLKVFAPDRRNTILLCGYQAAGTRGEALRAGAEEIKIHGKYTEVRAEVCQINTLSAHGDYKDLLSWLGRSELDPKRVFVTHGEAHAADAFRLKLKDTFGWNAMVPEYAETYLPD